jgi:hypothetical protein
MIPWLNLDDIESKRWYSWIGLGKSSDLTHDEVRGLVDLTYWRQNVLNFLLEKEVRAPLPRTDSDTSCYSPVRHTIQ